MSDWPLALQPPEALSAQLQIHAAADAAAPPPGCTPLAGSELLWRAPGAGRPRGGRPSVDRAAAAAGAGDAWARLIACNAWLDEGAPAAAAARRIVRVSEAQRATHAAGALILLLRARSARRCASSTRRRSPTSGVTPRPCASAARWRRSSRSAPSATASRSRSPADLPLRPE